MTNKGNEKRRSKEDLLAAGLQILARHGEGALTISSLCTKLGVTKGSFYHHFSSREDFSRELLHYWETEHTKKCIELCNREDSAFDSYCTLDTIALELDDDVEVAIRAWSLRDPLAKEFQQRVDETRMHYLQQLYEKILCDAKKAELLTQIDYSMFIGLRQIMPRVDKERLSELIDMWTSMIRKHIQGEKS